MVFGLLMISAFWHVWCIGGSGDGLIDLYLLVKYLLRRISSKGIDPWASFHSYNYFWTRICLWKESVIFGYVGKMFWNPGKQTLVHLNLIVWELLHCDCYISYCFTFTWQGIHVVSAYETEWSLSLKWAMSDWNTWNKQCWAKVK